jgi:hypothetical protein
VRVCVCHGVCARARAQRARTHRDIYLALLDASTQLLEASSCALFVTEGVYVVSDHTHTWHTQNTRARTHTHTHMADE